MAKVGPLDNGKNYPPLIERVQRGEDILAAHHNELVEAINRGTTGHNTPLNFSRVAEELVFVRMFQIKVVNADSLTCIHATSSTDPADEIYTDIAKPFMLRTTLLDHGDVTFTFVSETERTASATGETDETQVIVPSYEVDDFIIGIRNISGGTGVIDDAGNSLKWIDLNIDARAWAKQAA
ncbi:MAG: hypothetical protein ACYSUD_10325 [Planctomycetota bacterium]|jgi:hypothetical protein